MKESDEIQVISIILFITQQEFICKGNRRILKQTNKQKTPTKPREQLPKNWT